MSGPIRRPRCLGVGARIATATLPIFAGAICAVSWVLEGFTLRLGSLVAGSACRRLSAGTPNSPAGRMFNLPLLFRRTQSSSLRKYLKTFDIKHIPLYSSKEDLCQAVLEHFVSQVGMVCALFPWGARPPPVL